MHRNLRNSLYALAGAAAIVTPVALTGFVNGPDPRHTAAPGDRPLACATSGCHAAFGSQGQINVHGGAVTAVFSQGATYTPGGDPVTITVRVTDPSNTMAGFQMTARRESDLANGQAGRFVAGQGSFVLCDNGSPRSQNGNCSANFPVEFIEHSAPRADPWTFQWTPPASDIGPVHFYVAGNAVNDNAQSDAGDHVYTAEFVLNPIGACTAPAPVIDSIISAGAFGARADFAAGSWLEIYGSNLSTRTTPWLAADFAEGAAPVVLDRVRVTIDGVTAYVGFVSPGQVNVQAPSGATGPSDVIVTNCTQTSAARSIPREATAPGMLAPPGGAFVIDGKQFLAALHLDGAFVGDIAGVTSRPAKPGDTIVAYGIGFGPADPAIEPGTVVGVANRVTETLAISMGGVVLSPGQIGYAGLAPGFVGLYQFNLTVPDLPDGDHQVMISSGGRAVPGSLFIRVRR